MVQLALKIVDVIQGQAQELELGRAVTECDVGQHVLQELDHAIAQLRSEHRTDEQMVRELYRLVVIYQAGAPDALENLRTSLDVYAEMMYEHMRKEETLLEDNRVVLPDEEWRAIASAFRADEDPLFGVQRRREFALLHHRIVNLLPRKMRAAATGTLRIAAAT